MRLPPFYRCQNRRPRLLEQLGFIKGAGHRGKLAGGAMVWSLVGLISPLEPFSHLVGSHRQWQPVAAFISDVGHQPILVRCLRFEGREVSGSRSVVPLFDTLRLVRASG